MEASTETPKEALAAAAPEKAPEVNELTAKQMAAAEEENALRFKKIIDAQQAAAVKAQEEPITILGLAAQGRDALLDGLRKHAEQSAPPEYVPPPRTDRQMSQLEAELEAGRRAGSRAAEQQANRPVPPKDPNEGFTTPVHRDGSHGPGINSRDPAILK